MTPVMQVFFLNDEKMHRYLKENSYINYYSC